jgi:quercetin dioxygenase-like cupin family protein
MSETDSIVQPGDATEAPKFKIFRAKDAVSLQKAGCMDFADFTPSIQANVARLAEAGSSDAFETRVLFTCPGFSLSYAWFKSGYMLPRHSHNGECLYYIIAGSLSLGTETLGKGDGFFLPPGMPYAYTAGEEGVEILEFRTAETFNLKWLTHGQAFWDKAFENTQRRRENWLTEKPPLGLPSNIDAHA